MSNKIISDYRSEALQGTIKLVDNKGNEKICIGMKPIILNNQWKPVRKGDLITIDGKIYRVLKNTKNIAEVLCTYSAGSSAFGTSNTYADSALDKFCNETFYNTLSEQVRSAIIDKSFSQDQWTTAVTNSIAYNGKYLNVLNEVANYTITLINDDYKTAIARHCYSLSVQDIIDYLGVTVSMTESDTTLTYTSIWKMFWNSSVKLTNKDCVLRSAGKSAASLTTNVMKVSSDTGMVSSFTYSNIATVHPAFQIDLSKVDYAIL